LFAQNENLSHFEFSFAVPMDYNHSLITIAELPNFVRLADKLLGHQECQDLISYLANHPKSGDLIEGTGGVRKLRWGRGSQGKRGGVRLIYYFYSSDMPLYLITLYAKNTRSNLSNSQRHELFELTSELVKVWQGRSYEQ